MDIIDLSKTNSIINQYMAEIRDAEYQKNRLLFRNNIMRVGEYEAFEISKSLHYEEKDIATPLGISKVNVPTDKIQGWLTFPSRFFERFRPCRQCFRFCLPRI